MTQTSDVTSGPDGVSRRSVLAGAVGVLGALGLGHAIPGPAASPMTAPPVNDLGEQARTMALHVHSSFSEGTGSMEAQLAEAGLAGVDVLWWTDHDWRMAAAGYRTVVHFDSLANETEAGAPWKWVPAASGSLASRDGGIVTSPTSPNDTSPTPGALRSVCVSAGPAEASYRWFADSSSSRQNERSNVAGLNVRLDVFAEQTGPDAWLEMLVQLSRRPPATGRNPMPYQLSYRFSDRPPAFDARGLLGVVWVPVVPGSWTTVVLTPADDIAMLWPDVEGADNSFSRLWLGATSRNGATSSGCFDYLRFQRHQVGNAALQQQRAFMAEYASRFPTVLQIQGLEVSYYEQHLNWYGGSPSMFDSSTWTKAKPHSKVNPYVLVQQQADLIHAGGGLASLNHPFGTGFSTTGGTPAARHTIVSGLLAAKPKLDVIEVGYAARMANLRGHLDLWDTVLRNGLPLMGTGVSDDHEGEHGTWTKNQNRFATCAWTTALDETSLVTAIAGGRTYCRELGTTPALDLVAAGGAARMGQVLVDGSSSTVDLLVLALGLPGGSTVRVVQGPVEFGSAALDPSSTTVAQIPASSFTAGQAAVVLDNTHPSFARVEVNDSTGRCIAFSNPVWLFQAPHPALAS
jgi:hypothetical protein